jgi:hypothetical protein
LEAAGLVRWCWFNDWRSSSAILRLDSFNVSASERAAVSTFIDSTQRDWWSGLRRKRSSAWLLLARLKPSRDKSDLLPHISLMPYGE